MASLRASGENGATVTKELKRLALDLGINPATADKRTRAARKAWMDVESLTVERAVQLYPYTDRSNQLALHMALLYRSYPFIYEIASQIGVSTRLGVAVRQSTIRDRLVRKYGNENNVHQAVHKVLQSFVSWGLISKTGQVGVYNLLDRRFITPEVSEVIIAGALEAGERDAIVTTEIENNPALFPFVIPPWTTINFSLLRAFPEGLNSTFIELVNR